MSGKPRVCQNQRTLRKAQLGFTLLEVLLAIGITAMIGLGVRQIFSTVLLTRERIDQSSDVFTQLQRSILIIERDITQFRNRGIRDALDLHRQAISDSDEQYVLELTRSGWRNPLANPRSELQRVAYRLDGDVLWRDYWPVLDQAQDATPTEQQLLTGVDSLTLRFLDNKKVWHDHWPLENQNASSQSAPAGLLAAPMAIEVSMTHQHYGNIKRVWMLGHFDPATNAASGDTGGDAGGNAGDGTKDDTGDHLNDTGENNGFDPTPPEEVSP